MLDNVMTTSDEVVVICEPGKTYLYEGFCRGCELLCDGPYLENNEPSAECLDKCAGEFITQ